MIFRNNNDLNRESCMVSEIKPANCFYLADDLFIVLYNPQKDFFTQAVSMTNAKVIQLDNNTIVEPVVAEITINKVVEGKYHDK